MASSAGTRGAFLEAILRYVDDAAGAAGRADVPRRSLDLGSIAALLDAAARLLDDDAVGLHLAAGFEFDALGLFSYAVLHAPTLGTALRNMERYSEAVTAGARPRLDRHGATASLHLPVWGPDDPRRLRQLDEAAVLFLLRMLRRLAGPGWTPRAIAFRHPAPDDLAAHRRLLGVPLRFGQPSSRILFAAADLERPVRDADRQRLPVVERHLEDVVSDDADPDAWRHELELQVASLVCDGHPSLPTVAPRMGMSVRTLQRRLDERGVSYRDLVVDVRMRIARRYLEQPEPGLGEIAFLLGYSELSAFVRAFRRRVGTSPGEYRRRARNGRRRQ